MTLFKQLLNNGSGRDFVVGDLHGQYDLFMRALEYHDFDFEHDRITAVGDLVNRGKDSLKILRLLSEPWFHAVAGNHEWRLSQYGPGLIRRELDKEAESYLQMIGTDWLLGSYRQLNDDKWADLITEVLNLIRQLPLLIQIGHGRDAVGVVHAQLPNNDWSANVSRLERMRKQTFWESDMKLDPHISHMLHGRAQVRAVLDGQDLERGITGIEWLIAGHTIVDQPMKSGNRIWIDTGAYRAEPPYGLSLLQLGSQPTAVTHFNDRRIVSKQFEPVRHSLQSLV